MEIREVVKVIAGSTVALYVFVVFVRYAIIHRFHKLVSAQIDGYWFLLIQADSMVRDRDTRYVALSPFRGELTESLFLDTPLRIALDLRRMAYPSWVSNSVFWEEINSLVPITHVHFTLQTME